MCWCLLHHHCLHGQYSQLPEPAVLNCLVFVTKTISGVLDQSHGILAHVGGFVMAHLGIALNACASDLGKQQLMFYQAGRQPSQATHLLKRFSWPGPATLKQQAHAANLAVVIALGYITYMLAGAMQPKES